MRKVRILWGILKRTRADKVVIGFLIFLLIMAAIIQMAEPGIETYGESLWYCYDVVSTTGFGDVIVVTFIGRICSVLITIYGIFVIAIVTAVVVNYYSQIVAMKQKETLAAFIDKLERLPELSEEELKEMSEKVKKMH